MNFGQLPHSGGVTYYRLYGKFLLNVPGHRGPESGGETGVKDGDKGSHRDEVSVSGITRKNLYGLFKP